MDKLIIGIPTIDQYDKLNKSLHSIVQNLADDLFKLVIINNGKKKINLPDSLKEKTQVVSPANNLGVSKSWNMIARLAFKAYKADQVLILNDDIIFDKNYNDIQNIIDDAKRYGVISSEADGWSAFILSKYAWDRIGEFDEQQYPKYFEESDYMQRMESKNIPHISDSRLNPKHV